MTQQNQMMTASNMVMFDTEQQGREAFNMPNLIFNPQAMGAIQQMANLLADHSGMVPDHFQGKPGDVMGVIMQAGRWGMDPIAVAQSTFVLNGKIGYEAKLMQAVARANGGIDFDVEYYGDWSRIQGNIKKEKRQFKGRGGSPYTKEVDVAAWSEADEKQVGIFLTGTFPDGKSKKIDIPLCTCFPRNSTNWTYDPQQQIYYTAVKRWVRRHAPHLGLGIQDYDDLAARQNTEREINPQPKAEKPQKVAQNHDEPTDLDDVLNDSPRGAASDRSPENATQTAPQQPEPASLDDVLTEQQEADTRPDNVTQDGEWVPTKYEQLVDLLNFTNSKQDYRDAVNAISEAVSNNELSQDETDNLRKMAQSVFDSFNQ